jgi:cytochrome d ubiquinol oxidase subunit II
MLLDYETLKLIWWLLVGVLLIGFVLTDGFDMGAGAILPFVAKNDVERRVVINTVAPHWDGNQVWFILAGGAIFAAWPAVYAAAFSGFYLAMMLTLFALFFRPVGFDYRSKIENPIWRNTWDWGLFVAGVIPPVIFGVAFGNLLQGVPFHYDEILRPFYTGNLFGLLNPFALLVGVVSLAMFVLHGAIYVQLRSENPVRGRSRQAALIAAVVLIAGFALAGIWLALGIKGYQIITMPPVDALPNPTAKEVIQVPGQWLANYSHYPLTMLAPLAGFFGAFWALIFTWLNLAGWAFLGSSVAIVGVIMTAGISMFPFVMPSSTHPSHSLTLWDAPSSHLTLMIMFWAAVIFLPIVLLYTIWCYRMLWGKVTEKHIQDNQHSVY